ncbi:MAG: hypothetical protein KDA68_22695 [Planctomycetaceae bacterium]|nr:hypothetical protein [Planctomycetaceae bacterium]
MQTKDSNDEGHPVEHLPNISGGTNKSRLLVESMLGILGLAIFLTVGRIMAEQLWIKECLNTKEAHLGISFDIYQKKFGHLPPGNEYREDDKAVVSWRVAMHTLTHPWEEVAKKYRFDEEWNSPHNSTLHATSHNWYRCPFDPSPKEQTSFVRISTPTTPFPDDRIVSKEEFADGAMNTILAVEMHNSGIHWMEPRDITMDQAIAGIRQESKPIVHTDHGIADSGKSTYAVFADGHVSRLKMNIDPKVLRSLLETNNPDKPKEKFISQ